MPEQAPAPRERFLSPRDRVLHAMCLGEWAVASGVTKDSSHWWMSTKEDDLTAIVDAFGEDMDEAGLVGCSPLVGNFVVVDSGEAVDVYDYPAPEIARAAFEKMRLAK